MKRTILAMAAILAIPAAAHAANPRPGDSIPVLLSMAAVGAAQAGPQATPPTTTTSETPAKVLPKVLRRARPGVFGGSNFFPTMLGVLGAGGAIGAAAATGGGAAASPQ